MTRPGTPEQQKTALEVTMVIYAYVKKDPEGGARAMETFMAGGSQSVVERLLVLAKTVALSANIDAATAKQTADAWATREQPVSFAAHLLEAAFQQDDMIIRLYGYKTTGKGGQFTVDVVAQLLRWYQP